MQFLTSVLALLFVVKLWRTSHKTPIEYLRARYGQNLVKIFRIWEDLWRKSERFKLDLEFLETCKAYDIFPKFVRFKLYKKSLHSADFYKSWQDKLLLNEIQCKRRELKKAQKCKCDAWNDLSSKIPYLLSRN